MPTPLPAHAIVQVRMVGSLFNQQVMTVLHYRVNSGSPIDDYRTAMSELADAFLTVNKTWDKWHACLSESVSGVVTYYQPVYPVRLTAYSRVPPNQNGLISGTDMGTNTAATVTKTTDVAARYGRGSCHLPGMVVESINPDTSEWSDDFQATLGGFGDSLLIQYELSDFVTVDPVIWQFKTPARYNIVTGRIVQTSPRVERRRTLRLGV